MEREMDDKAEVHELARAWAKEDPAAMVSAIRDYGKQCAREAVTEMAQALQTAHIAMTLARALPGVADEYDFGPAIDEARKALALPLPAKQPA